MESVTNSSIYLKSIVVTNDSIDFYEGLQEISSNSAVVYKNLKLVADNTTYIMYTILFILAFFVVSTWRGRFSRF